MGKWRDKELWSNAHFPAARNEESDSVDYFAVSQEQELLICDTTGAVTVGGGVAGDVLLDRIVILKNAGPATATVNGFYKKNNSGAYAAQSFVLTGSTSGDMVYEFGGVKNAAGALTVTASVDEAVLVVYRAAG